jgi:hypothetical protein
VKRYELCHIGRTVDEAEADASGEVHLVEVARSDELECLLDARDVELGRFVVE